MLLVLALGAVTPMQELSEEYLRELWKSSPMSASQMGWHRDGVDRKLDDLSASARKSREQWLGGFGARLLAAKPRDDEERADAELLRDAVDLELNELEQARQYQRRCDLPLDSLGSVFFAMVARPYAPLEQRAADVIARLDAAGRFLAQARASLTTNVDVFREAAKDDGAGVIDYLEHDLIPAFAKSKSATLVKSAAGGAIRAIREYLAFVDGELAKRPKASFRYGKHAYGERFKPYLQTDRTPADVLAAARKRLAEVQREMAQLARKILPGAPKDDHAAIRAALAKVAEDHPAPDALFSTVKADLAQARAFVRDKKLLTLPAHDNLQVIETPPFLRSQYGVGAFDGAPPLEPSLGAFYYVTPFPKDWPKERVESKLREYNRYMLQLLTIHEAMPGHYVQLEHANAVQPEWRRVLRRVLGADAYIEGWATYAQDMMIDAGYLDGDSKLRLTNDKMELRVIANTILDIELQAGEMSDEQAMRLMLDEAFQEKPEAEAKLRRAKLSVTQLCSYFVGLEAWRALRKKAGGDLRAYHNRVLSGGAVTLPTLLAK